MKYITVKYAAESVIVGPYDFSDVKFDAVPCATSYYYTDLEDTNSLNKLSSALCPNATEIGHDNPDKIS